MIDGVRRSGSRSVSLVVGFAPDGSADILARLLAQKLGDSLKQPVLVDSRPGAGATIATVAVAAAKPDGYTLLLATSGHAGSSTLYLGFDIPSSALPHIKSGELRPVAVTTRMRLSVLPAAVVDRLNQDGNAVLKIPTP